MIPIFRLTLRQLIWRRRYLIVLLLSALAVLLSTLVALFGDDTTVREDHDFITAQLFASLTLPLAALLLSTATLGDEIEDQTLVYLLLKPIPRWRVVVPKLLATMVGVVLPIATSGIVSSFLISGGDVSTSLATGAGIALGAVAYCTVFCWAGLVSRQAIIFGIGYAFLWEAVVTNLFAGLRYVSVRQYTLGVIQGLDDQRLTVRSAAGAVELELVPALVGCAIVVLIFGWLTERRLRLMDIP